MGLPSQCEPMGALISSSSALFLCMAVMYVSPHCDIHVIVVAVELCHFDTARKIGNNNITSLSRLRFVLVQSSPFFIRRG